MRKGFAKIAPHEMARARSTRSSNSSSANIGFEQKRWLAAEKTRTGTHGALHIE